jgi:2-iminobutanoate/2-iminopropanoate deaminase
MLRSLLLTVLLLAPALYAQKRQVIEAPELAPKPGAPAPMFSPGILVDGTLYIAGQTGQDPKTGDYSDNFEAEVKTTLDRVGYILKAAGMTYDHVVSVQVYLTDMDLFQRMNAVYSSVFKAPRPARTTVGVTKLASPKAHIEITVTAKK